MSKNTNSKSKKKKTGKEIAVIVFAIFIAISMMVPSIGYIVSYYQYNQNGGQQTAPVTAEQVNETFQKQIDEINKSIEADPQNADLKADLGNVYLQWAGFTQYFPQDGVDLTALTNERVNKALEAFDASVQIKSTDSGVIGKSYALNMLQKTDEAISGLEAFVAENPESIAAYNALAQIYQSAGQSDKAVAAYEKMIELAPDTRQDIKDKAQAAIDQIKGASSQASDSEKSEDASKGEESSK